MVFRHDRPAVWRAYDVQVKNDTQSESGKAAAGGEKNGVRRGR
jgi:hypothetical protein